MAVIKLKKRIKFAGDVFDALMKKGWSCTDAADFVNSFPDAEAPEVVHGRWLGWGKNGTPTYENYGTCSVCHQDAEIHTEHRNYCPNCGAKMDGDGND